MKQAMSTSEAAHSALPTQHFLRCSRCCERMRLDAVHTDTNGSIVWAAFECEHTRVLEWYPDRPLRIDLLSGLGNPWRSSAAQEKGSSFDD